MRVVLFDMMRDWRGGQRQFLLLARGLLERGVEPLLICRRGSALHGRARAARVPTIPLTIPFEADFTAIRRVARILRDFDADVLHFNDSHSHWIGGAAALFVRRVVRVASRRVDFHIFRHGFGFSYFKYRYMADAYIAVSRAARDVLVRCGVRPERVFVVESGLPPAAPQAVDVRPLLGVPERTRVVGSVGALVWHKGHEHLIDAAALLAGRTPGVAFVVVGDGPLRRRLERRIEEKGLRGRFFLPGRRGDAEALVGSFDVFVMPSVMEGLGSSVLDAYRHGVPAVVTDAGGLPEVAGGGAAALVVPKGDARALAAGIERALSDKMLRSRLAEAGRGLLLRRFSADIMIERSVSVYERLIRGRRKWRSAANR